MEEMFAFQKTYLGTTCKLDESVTDVREYISLNALSPMDVTESGIVTDVKLVPSNALLPIDRTPLPIFTDVRLLTN